MSCTACGRWSATGARGLGAGANVGGMHVLGRWRVRGCGDLQWKANAACPTAAPRRRDLAAAIWRPDQGLAEVVHQRGKLLSHMGFTRGAKLFLHIEEAVCVGWGVGLCTHSGVGGGRRAMPGWLACEAVTAACRSVVPPLSHPLISSI